MLLVKLSGFGFTEVLTTDFEADKKGDLFSPNSAERICVAKDLKTELLKNETLNIFGEGLSQLFILPEYFCYIFKFIKLLSN